MKFEIDGDIYEVTEDDVIHHINPKPFVYDKSYVGCYDGPEYQKGSETLQAMRFGFVASVHGRPIRSLLDYGYGQGDFMKFARRQVQKVYGYDLTRVHVDDCEVTNKLRTVDVITFNDALEHVPDLDFVKDLPCETVVISLPNCQFHIRGLEWFRNWYHRKPSEHLHFFDEQSLKTFMSNMGWRHIATSRHEDLIRKRGDDWNILTCGFKRK